MPQSGAERAPQIQTRRTITVQSRLAPGAMARGIPPHPNSPPDNATSVGQPKSGGASPVYRPAQIASSQTALQQKPGLIGPPVYRPQQPAPSAQSKSRGAPPVYRPAQIAANQTALQPKPSLIGPPVYRPQQGASSTKSVSGGAPPVYRPEGALSRAGTA